MELREEGYYPLLIELFKKKGLEAVQLPAKTEAGFPDIKVFQKDGFITGYIECKKPEEDIEKWAESKQVKRYKSHFKNFLLTNFISFKHFINGKEVKTVNFIPYRDLKKGNFKVAKLEEFKELFKDFINYQEKPIKSVEELAENLAWRVKLLKEELLKELKTNTGLQEFLSLLRNYVIHTLTEEEFADAIAQSLAYALLIVRTKKEPIRKEDVISDIPDSLTVIRDIFLEILKIEGKELNWIIEEIENTLNLFDLKSTKLTPEELTVHFYETFLRAYNPKLREIRGVYYTPKPVVKFIVKSIEELLKKDFGLNGYFDERLKLLDPAGGTLTFILEIFEELRRKIKKEAGSGMLKSYFENTVLKNFFAFELLPAPYVIGHLKVSQFLDSLGVKNKRFNFYLTNALEFEHKTAGYLFSHRWAKEIQEADRIKREEKMLVILGNPPYSGISANNSKEINEFLKKDIDNCQSYYKVGGRDLKEFVIEVSGSKKVKVWLQDDYVKFIRFGQWKIEKSGKGVVGFITNHSYIDNPTFAGMRESLLKTFDRIYILNLHGNKRKKEPDENVFDIMQGVAVGIFVKDGTKEGDLADVYYYSTLYDEGIKKREEKLAFLTEKDIKSINWKKAKPEPPFYFFFPTESRKEWESLFPVNRIFEKFVSGIVTARDNLVIGFTPEEVKEKIETFLNDELSDEEIRKLFFKKRSSAKYPAGDTRSWKLSEVRNLLRRERQNKKLETFIKPILYRPFDVRFIFYHPLMIDWDRREVMKHMLSDENLGLVIGKSNKSGDSTHFFVSRYMTEAKTGEATTQSYLFPLYLYTENGKLPNFTREFKSYIKGLYSQQPLPEEIFYYIYAVLYSPSYREKYGEFLKYEFPRIPFPESHEKLKEVAEIGEKLVNLHLLKDPSLSAFTVKFEGKGNNKVEKVSYKSEKVHINNNQYFYPVKKDVWEYRIGGYQVLKKWLSDRKNRVLTYEDITTYLKIIKTLQETIKIQKVLTHLFKEIFCVFPQK